MSDFANHFEFGLEHDGGAKQSFPTGFYWCFCPSHKRERDINEKGGSLKKGSVDPVRDGYREGAGASPKRRNENNKQSGFSVLL